MCGRGRVNNSLLSALSLESWSYRGYWVSHPNAAALVQSSLRSLVLHDSDMLTHQFAIGTAYISAFVWPDALRIPRIFASIQILGFTVLHSDSVMGDPLQDSV